MSVDHKRLLREWTSKERSLPIEYYATYIPELCEKIESLERVARETGMLYQQIEEDGYGGGIHFGYVSSSSVEEQFPRMFRLLLNKVRKDADQHGYKRAVKYYEENKILPLKQQFESTKSIPEHDHVTTNISEHKLQFGEIIQLEDEQKYLIVQGEDHDGIIYEVSVINLSNWEIVDMYCSLDDVIPNFDSVSSVPISKIYKANIN